MNIEKQPYWLTEEGIGIVEEKYGGATFMGAWAIKKKDGGWFDEPVDVFYQPNPDTSKGHSHYFGIFIRTGEAYITNAESAFKLTCVSGVGVKKAIALYNDGITTLEELSAACDAGKITNNNIISNIISCNIIESISILYLIS